jgi:hypothetical protein
MEGLALILIGGALFAQSWNFLGLYSDGRTVGAIVGALGLAALLTLVLAPMVLIGGNEALMTELKGNIDKANPLAELTVMRMLIILWAAYAIGVGTQSIWDYEERAIGLYSAFLSAGTAVAFFYFATQLFNAYGDAVAIGLSAATLVLSVVAGMVFFYLTVPFTVLRLVSGWFLLVGSIAVTGVGFAIITTIIEVTKP